MAAQTWQDNHNHGKSSNFKSRWLVTWIGCHLLSAHG